MRGWKQMTGASTGRPVNLPEIIHLIRSRDGNPLGSKSYNLSAADGAELDGAQNSIGRYNSEPR
jgi:hypothetical protein